jgi:hypothetical protein
MHGRRTAGWYLTRLLLAIGIAAFLFAGWLFLFEPVTMGGGPRLSEQPVPLAGLVGIVVGLVWMIRIFRGPRDEPPPWRYRDR